MQVENYLQDPTRFNLNDFRKKIKWVDGKIDLNDLWAQLTKVLRFVDQPDGTNQAAKVSHLFGSGYASQFYGYLWS